MKEELIKLLRDTRQKIKERNEDKWMPTSKEDGDSIEILTKLIVALDN